jgi:hypothetical protein
MNTFTILKGLLGVTPKSDIRYYLSAVHLTATRMQASDGRIAMQVEVTTAMPDGVVEVLVCRRDLATKLKLFTAKSECAIRVDLGGKVLLNEYELTTVDARYPDLDRATRTMRASNAPAQGLGFNVKAMAQACNAVASVCAGDKFIGAEFNAYDGGVRITRGPVSAYVMPCRL